MAERQYYHRVRRFCEENHIFSKGDRVAVAFSGGADSVFLACILMDLAKVWELELSLIHVHHGIRGAEADRDEQFCRDFADVHGLPIKVYHGDVPALAAERGISEEEAAREYRYECIFSLLDAENIGKAAVAHHQDDQAETVLFQMLRGSSLRGLGGMKPVQGRIVRPLLPLCHEEMTGELMRMGQPWCEDSTNAQMCYQRNIIRHQVIPLLKEKVNPAAAAHLSRLALQMQQVQAFLDEELDKRMEKLLAGEEIDKEQPVPTNENTEEELTVPTEADEEKEGAAPTGIDTEKKRVATTGIDTERERAGTGTEKEGISQAKIRPEKQQTEIDIRRFQTLPEVLRSECAYRMLVRKAGRGKDITFRHIESLLKLAEGESGKRLHLPYDLIAGKDQDRLWVRDKSVQEDSKAVIFADKPVCWTKERSEPMEFFLHRTDGKKMKFCFHREDFSQKTAKIPKNSCTKWIDYARIDGAFEFRHPRQGDALWLSPGKRGRKALNRLFIDLHVPKEDRELIWVLADGEQIVWIPELGRVNAEYYITEQTQEILCMEMSEE